MMSKFMYKKWNFQVHKDKDEEKEKKKKVYIRQLLVFFRNFLCF